MSELSLCFLDPPPWPPPRPSMLLNKASTDVVNRNDFPSVSFSYSTPRALSIAIPLEKKVTFEQQSLHGDQMERNCHHINVSVTDLVFLYTTQDYICFYFGHWFTLDWCTLHLT
ncbi:hypothetical protein Scep_015239 [Stephania cephalantha]|uniref:Uncharacterized protein n=1 Tax=Stephania cephalantha TaxID=152367 RepID=A0AAP0J4R4_9MAGN